MRITSCASAPRALHDVADLVGEADLQGVEGVGHVLHHLRRADAVARTAPRRRRRASRRRATASGLAAPTSVKGGCAKSRSDEPSRMNSGIHRDVQAGRRGAAPPPASKAGTTSDSVVPGQHRAAEHDHGERLVAVREGLADLSAHALAGRSCRAAPLRRLGVPTQTRATLRRGHGLLGGERGVQPPRRHHLRHELGEAGLDDGGSPRVHHGDLLRVDVHAHTSWPARARQAPLTQPDVSETEHANSRHGPPPRHAPRTRAPPAASE